MNFLSGIRKYYLGLAVVGIFVIAITIFVLSLASATKQDTNTYNQANTIAEKLNNYISQNQQVPGSLSSAKITNVPSTISYTKNSGSSYTFCVTYRQATSNFSSTGIDALTGSVPTQTNDTITTGVPSSSLNTELFIDSNHHKGQNCQKVQPYIYMPICGINSNLFNTSNTTCTFNSTTTTPVINNSPTINNQSSIISASTDTQRSNDVNKVDSLINDYVSNNANNAFPDVASISVKNGILNVGYGTNTSTVSLQFYVNAGQVAARQYTAGDKNVTVNNIVIEFKSICSDVDPAAGDSSSFVILYSDSTGKQCQDG